MADVLGRFYNSFVSSFVIIGISIKTNRILFEYFIIIIIINTIYDLLDGKQI